MAATPYMDPTCKTPMLERPCPKQVPNKSTSDSGSQLKVDSLPREMTSVIVNQPAAVTEKIYHSSVMNDNYLVLSIGLCILSLTFCCFWTLIFSIPAIIYSVKARKAFKNTEYREMVENEKIAFGFNIGVIVCWIVSLTIVIGVTYRELCGPTGIDCNTSPYRPDN